jgi:hypothetical protein
LNKSIANVDLMKQPFSGNNQGITLKLLGMFEQFKCLKFLIKLNANVMSFLFQTGITE